jgi:alkanesulfonate monooxygenase SsuD/methylene tetrahydromethanopterin reductase-like flavin-dependent oxidoreductase (luciferase family)
MTAMTAATLDQLSDGRFRLGLGPSGPQVSEGWHGVRFAKQLRRTREYVEVVRMALRPSAWSTTARRSSSRSPMARGRR